MERSPTVQSGRTAVAAGLLLALAVQLVSIGDASTSAGASWRTDTPIVFQVDRSRLERTVAKLSGGDTIRFGDEAVSINTRYARSPLMARVREYLVREIRAIGYEPALQPFMLELRIPDLTGVTVSAGHDTVWAADADGNVYRNTAASGWTRFQPIASIAQSAFDLERDARGRLWLCCRLTGSAGGALFASADGGVTWTEKVSGAGIFGLATLSFEDETFAMAGGSNGTVLYTADGGNNWVARDPAAVGLDGMSGSAQTGPWHFWFVSETGSVYETRDLGGAWSKRSLMLGRLGGIDFRGESTGVIVGSQRAFYTRDAGTTWTPVVVPAELTSVTMLDSLRVVAGAGLGEIWMSEDGGVSWARFGAECGVPATADVWGVASAGRDTCWLAGRDYVRRIIVEGERRCESWNLADTLWCWNIAFRREGIREPSRRIVLGSHYDSYSGASSLTCAPGADDNASGVAAVLECARILRDVPLERTVEFVLFDAEELGLKGSRFFVSELESGARYEGMLALDMIGYEPNALMTAVIAGRAANAGDSIIAGALEAAIDSFALPLQAPYLTGAERLTSDQIAFQDGGIPAVLLIEGTRDELTPQYHRCSDGPTLLNYDFLEVCTQTALGAIARLASTLPFEPPRYAFALDQNYPNPFNAGTIVAYTLAAAGRVELAVFDVAGRRIAVIDKGTREAGQNVARWDGRDGNGILVQSGVYLLRLRAGPHEAVRKMVILR